MNACCARASNTEWPTSGKPTNCTSIAALTFSSATMRTCGNSTAAASNCCAERKNAMIRTGTRWCEDWRTAMTGLQAAVADINEKTRGLMPGWDDPSWQSWQPPATVPPVLRLGQYHVQLDQIAKGIPTDAGLRALTPAAFDLPALCDFPRCSSLLLQASDAGRRSPCRRCKRSMLRLLTVAARRARCASPSSTRSAWAQNFAAFMHLADYDEPLVGSRIWTEAAHIEQRLADLTAHMENVIQKYLRNQFETHRGVQRPGRRGGRAVPLPGGRQLPGQLHGRGRPPAGQHRAERRALRRLHAHQRRYPTARCRKGFDLDDLEAAERRPRLGRTSASAGRTRDFGRSR